MVSLPDGADASGALTAPRRLRHQRPAAGKATAVAVAAMLMGMLGAGAEVTPAASTEALDTGHGAVAPGPAGYFEPNLGQFPDNVRFLVRGGGTEAFLTDGGAAFVLHEAPEALDALPNPFDAGLEDAAETSPEPSLLTVQLRFEGAEPGAMEGAEKRQGISNHFIGNDPDKWVTHVPHYARVVQRDMWPGIDVEWHITPEGLKFDAVVHPGADPRQVRFTLPGADAIALDAKGDLRIATPLGELVKQAPYTYQETTKGVQEVPSRYVLDDGAVGFDIGDHDPSRALVIDPLIYATHLGVSSTGANGIVVDDEGHAYVTGTTGSNFPTTPGAYQTSNPGSTSVFVMKLTPAGDDVVFSTYLGGTGTDRGWAIAVDGHGNAYLTGQTSSEDFPTVSPAYQAALPGFEAAFFTKLNATGGRLDNSTYLGGSMPASAGVTGAWTHGYSIAVDAAGSAYIAGATRSRNFPAPGPPGGAYPFYTGAGNFVAFVAKFTPEGDDLEYATHLGGSATSAEGIAVDNDGSAYVTGWSMNHHGSPPHTTPGAFQQQPPANIIQSAFVTKFTPDGMGLAYGTHLGGSGRDWGYGIAVDGDGHAYVFGTTDSDDFPTENPYQGSNPGTSAFLTKMNPDGTGLVYSTYLGGDGAENGAGIAVDGDGRAYVTGTTSSGDFPLRNPYQETGGTFVAAFQSDGSDVLWSTRFPGVARSVAVDASGSAYVAGGAGAELPTTPGAYRQSGAGFAAKLYGVVADFDWSPQVPCPGGQVQFRDLSVSLSGTTGTAEPPARSQWDFGDGGSPWLLDPWQNVATHTYFEEGNHSVTLTAYDAFGASGSVTRVVEVPWCPPPNYPPVLAKLPCIIASPEQKLSFQVRASVPVFPGDPPSYSDLSFFAEGLPSGATFQQDGPLTARITWIVGPPDTYTFVVHVEDGGLPEHDVPSLRDSEEYCVEVRPEKTAPPRSDASGDGVQNWHDACPHVKNPDQGDAEGGGLDDPCEPAAPPEPEEAPAEEEGPPPGGCPSQPVGPREVTARWTDGSVQITWQSDSWCPPDHFLVWNGTGHHLVDFILAEAGVHYVVLNTDPWPEPHQYYVQAMGADEGLFFDPTRAVGSNLIDPAGCVAEGARSEVCLPLGNGDEPPAAVEPAGPEAAAPADGAPIGLIAAAFALVVGGFMAVLWRLRHAPWVVHLFTRLGREDVLDHPARKEIMGLVTAEPGIHYMEILRRTGASHGVLQHHLKALAAAGMVSEHKAGQYLCYYPPPGPEQGSQEIRELLRADVAQRLLRLLVAEPGLPVAELARRLGTARSSVRYHLERFEKGKLARVERHASKAQAYPGELGRDALASLGRAG